jgi:hypothetical protein
MTNEIHNDRRPVLGVILCVTAWLIALPALPAEPPSLLNYQGVLRDASDLPLEGSFNMIFRFWSAPGAGAQILIDEHPAGGESEVIVSGGLFNVALGSGDLFDGPGPGTYASLAEVFRDYETVWLEVEVDSEVLSPRIRIVSGAYAMNARHLNGKDSNFFLDTSSTPQTKAGPFTVIASGAPGVQGFSPEGGGYFEETGGSGRAYVGNTDRGIWAYGDHAGGYFTDSNGSGYAYAGYGDYGIEARGNLAGGYFVDRDNSGYAYVGNDEFGVKGYGNAAGGYFKDGNNSGYAYVGNEEFGIKGYGNAAGGYFKDNNSTGYVYVGYGNYGVESHGSLAGGYFNDSDSSGHAFVGNGEFGIKGYGDDSGGYFARLDGSGWASVGTLVSGIDAFGEGSGGRFENTDSGNHAFVASFSYKILGPGTVSFIQNHPDDESKVVIYHAPEASEVAVYTRGSARLENGIARIELDETFQWVANPDLGLTAHLTPRGASCLLHVIEVSTGTLGVAADDPGCSSAAFDYMVWGLRIGFEELAPLQPKRDEAHIPSMEVYRELYADDGSLRRFNALERFRDMETELRGVDSASLDLSRASDLIARIGEYDPEVHGPTVRRSASAEAAPAENSPREGDRDPRTSEVEPASRTDAMPGVVIENPVDVSVTPELPAGASLFSVGEAVEPGDLLKLDPEDPEQLTRAATAADPTVVGIVAAEVIDGDGVFRAPVFGTGFAVVKVDAGYGAVLAGDLLTSSPTPGHAMVAINPVPGTIVGKALEPLDHGTGLIRILVNVR